LTSIEQSKVIHEGRTFFHLPSFGTVAAIARLRPSHPLVTELLAESERTDGQPWHTFHEWTELAAATVVDATAFVDLAVEISRLVQINDLFAEYIHRPLTARLRRDTELSTGLAELVPGLSGSAIGIAIRLLALSGRLNGPLVDHLHARLASRREEGGTDTFDPLRGQPCHVELLILDILDTIDG
jgi:hypothetical protein